jgi:hypothetical protein
MKTFTQIIAITLCSLPLLANAAGKSSSAAMQVSFEVKESCTVQTADKAAKAAPAVTCQLKTPYQLRDTAPAAAAATDAKAGAIRQEAAPGEWTLYF